MNVIRRLVAPALVLVVFVVIFILNRDLLVELGSDALGRSQMVLAYGLQIGLWLSGAFFINRLLVVLVWDGVVPRALSTQVPRLVKDLNAVVIYFIAVTGIIGVVFGRSITGVYATSGALGIVIGFAIQNIILDIFSGVALNLEHPFKLGDWISIHDRMAASTTVGEVTEINWRTTRIKTSANNIVVIPNSLLSTSMVTNFMIPDRVCRYQVELSLDSSVPCDRVHRVLAAAVMSEVGANGILESPPPLVETSQVNDIGVEYTIKYYIDPTVATRDDARSRVITSTLNHLRQAGIGLAYPKEDIFHAELPQRQFDSLSEQGRTELLGRIGLFASLLPEERGRLAAVMVRRYFESGSDIIVRDDVGASMFVLVEGLVGVYIDPKGTGEEVRVAQLKPGSFFGEMSLLTGEKRSATIRATTAVVAYEIMKEDLGALLDGRPEIGEILSRAVAEAKLRDVQAKAKMSEEEKEEQTQGMARQILGQIRSFFKSG